MPGCTGVDCATSRRHCFTNPRITCFRYTSATAMNTLRRSLALFLFFAVSASPALRADTLFSSLNSTLCGCGNGSITQGWALASAFTPTSDYLLTGAAAKLHRTVPGATVDFSIYTNSGTVPGTSLLDIGAAMVTSDMAYSKTVSPSIELFSGQQYWLVLTQTSSLTFTWDGSGSASSPFAFLSPGSSWIYDAPAALQFSISGNPVAVAAAPEPESLSLLLLGIGTLPALLRLNSVGVLKSFVRRV